jgi:hypothetical protein
MAIVWSSLSVGDKITYAHGAGIDELRDNCDTLHVNLTDRTHDHTVNAYDATVNAYDSTVNSNNAYCGAHDGAIYASNYANNANYANNSNYANYVNNTLQGYK